MALPHLVHDGENGYLFEPGDPPEDLAAKLRTVLEASPEEYRALKEARSDSSPRTTSRPRSTSSRACIVGGRSPTR